MSEYETDPDWSYMGVTVEDRRRVTLGRTTDDALRIVTAPRDELSQEEQVLADWWHNTFLPIRTEWEQAARVEQARVEKNRARWRKENEQGREEREQLVRNAVVAKPSLLNRRALVVYRCKSHGCLLGAAMQSQGYLYEIWQTHAEPGWIPADEIQEWAHAEGVNGWVRRETDQSPPDTLTPAQARRIIDDTEGDYEKDGNPIRADWHPQSLSEWLSVDEPARTHRGLFVECVEHAPWDTLFGYPGRLVNCRHVEYRLTDRDVRPDMKRLRGQQRKVIAVNGDGPRRRWSHWS